MTGTDMNTTDANNFMASCIGEVPCDIDMDACDLEIVGERSLANAAAGTRKILQQAQRDRRPPPPMRIVPLDSPSSEHDDPVTCVLGESSRGGGGFPILQRLHDWFSGRTPKAKPVRVDTEASYAEFVSKKDFVELDSRLRELRAAYEEHLADEHGPKTTTLRSWDAIIGAADDLTAMREGANSARVPASFPPHTNGKIACWREGDMLCCSVRLPGADGNPVIATTVTPVEEHIADVMGYMQRAGVNPIDVLGALPMLTHNFGTGGLVPQLAQAAPALLADPAVQQGHPVLLRMEPTSDPGVASIMSLCQMVQSGDPNARAEWDDLVECAMTPGCEPLADAIEDGTHRLEVAQHVKAMR